MLWLPPSQHPLSPDSFRCVASSLHPRAHGRARHAVERPRSASSGAPQAPPTSHPPPPPSRRSQRNHNRSQRPFRSPTPRSPTQDASHTRVTRSQYSKGKKKSQAAAPVGPSRCQCQCVTYVKSQHPPPPPPHTQLHPTPHTPHPTPHTPPPPHATRRQPWCRTQRWCCWRWGSRCSSR